MIRSLEGATGWAAALIAIAAHSVPLTSSQAQDLPPAMELIAQ